MLVGQKDIGVETPCQASATTRKHGGPLGFARGRLFDCVAARCADGNFAQDDN